VPVLESLHDYAHPVESSAAWSESYYFNAYDPGTGTGLFSRIGIRPNAGTIDVTLHLWLPNGEHAAYREVREQHTMVDGVLEVGAVRYEMLEPMKRWRLTMVGDARIQHGRDRSTARRGDVAVDVTFDALMPPVGVDGQGAQQAGAAARASDTVGKGHFEQAGRWQGGITVDGRDLDWSAARGNRDKSWGPRHVGGGLQMWRWFSINIDDETHFGGIRIGTDAGDVHRGWVWAGGEATSVAEWRVRTELGADDLTQHVCHVVATDKRGHEHHLRAEVLNVVAFGGGNTLLNEGLSRWAYEGRVGYGISEYLHRLDEGGRPVVAIE
jgi:hypothetical protein